MAGVLRAWARAGRPVQPLAAAALGLQPQRRRQATGTPGPARGEVHFDSEYDAVVVGGGHNGLTAAAYLARGGLKTLVLERRHLVGGAAVTEELYPGFKYSRASYLAGLLRPQIIDDLQLGRYGFRYLPRDPSSFTPSPLDGEHGGKSLFLSADEQATHASIAQFSAADADSFAAYERFLSQVRDIITPIIDGPPPEPFTGSARDQTAAARQLWSLMRVGWRNREALVPLYELLTAPATVLLDRWFESNMLKTTLATDAVIGALCSPSSPGSGYVLLHHAMGEAAGQQGVWAYVEGGMGAVSEALAASARAAGAEICVSQPVREICWEGPSGAGGGAYRATGVVLGDGTVVRARAVLSNATPYHTFEELLARHSRGTTEPPPGVNASSPVPASFASHIRSADYACGAFKINCAVSRLPDFACLPNAPGDTAPGPQHRGTIHFENHMHEIEAAHRDAASGRPARRPVIEMTIPSSLDSTVAPPGQHVVQFFVQYAPYSIAPALGGWDAHKEAFADRVFQIVDSYCPGFSSSVLHRDVLSPLDLERVFGLRHGNILHGAIHLHQIAYARPAPGFSGYRMPLSGLYLCGAGAHPGGGVMGAAGRNCAQVVLRDFAQGGRS